MKKIIIPIVVLAVSFFIVLIVSATANTHSYHLEAAKSQKLSIANPASQSMNVTTSAFTIECWIKPASVNTNGNNSLCASMWASGNDNASYVMWYDTQSGQNNLRLQVINAAQQEDTLSVSQALTVGSWQHIAVSWLGSSRTAKWYLNGSQIGTDQVGDQVTSIQQSTADFEIGYRIYLDYFDGLIDEVRMWNDVRTQEEISANYQTELTGAEEGLVAYWKLNDSLLDETVYNHDLTNTNSATSTTDVPFAGSGGATVKSSTIIITQDL